MKIFFQVDHSGCAWWRSRQPAAMIKKLGLADVQILSLYEMNPQELDGVIKWSDVIIGQSAMGVQSVTIALAYKEMGKVLLVDYDDLTFSCSPFNPAYKTMGLEEVKIKKPDSEEEYYLYKDGENGFSIKDNYFRYRSQQDIMNIVDGITTTTDCLKKAFMYYVPEREKDIYILPNSIDFSLYRPFPKIDTGQVRIGWTASSSHGCEIWLVKNTVKRLLKKYGDKIKFVQLGSLRELSYSLTPDEMEFHYFVDLNVYPLKFASLNLDIGICPLENTEFNKHKSALKWSEFSALRIPTVCSNLEPYFPVEEGVTGLLAKDENEFYEKLCILIDNAKLRKDIADNAFQKNYEDFNLEKNCKLWVKAYEESTKSSGGWTGVYREKALRKPHVPGAQRSPY